MGFFFAQSLKIPQVSFLKIPPVSFLKTPPVSFSLILLFSMLCQWEPAEGWSYHHSNNRMNWTEAEAWCKLHYTNMVAIQNHGEIAHLDRALPQVQGHYWIGIRKTNGTWTWIGTNKTLTVNAENWAEGEPNNIGKGEDCVEIYIKRAKDSGKWNDEACSKKKTALCYTASCKDDSCSRHGDCVETINSHRCECFEGFYGDKCEQVIQCQAENISDPMHGSVHCSHPNGHFTYGSLCEYSCSEGYQITGSQSTRCEASTAWSSAPPTCEVIQCSELSAPAKGAMWCEDPLGRFSFRSTCTFTCQDGYTLTDSGSAQLVCSATGHWNGSVPTCEAVRCPALEEPVNGTLSCTGDRVSFGSSCSFSCNEGFRLQGAPEITCTKSAQWSLEVPYCEAIRCRLPGEQPHLSPECSRNSEDLTVNSTCHFSCDTGFDLQGAASSKCTETGEWTPAVPHCTAVMCPRLQELVNGFINCSAEKATFGTVCSFECFDGYSLHGYDKVTCNLWGNWSGEAAECQAAVPAALLTRPMMTVLSVGAGATGLSSLCLVLWIIKKLRGKANKFNLSNSDINMAPQTYKNSTDSLI